MRLLLAEDEEDMSNALVKILKSNNKELQDVAMYIANSDDIVDKFYALKVLNPENAQQIRA